MEEKKKVVIILPDEARVLQDIQGRALDRQHDIDGCNEYKSWETERKKRWF